MYAADRHQSFPPWLSALIPLEKLQCQRQGRKIWSGNAKEDEAKMGIINLSSSLSLKRYQWECWVGNKVGRTERGGPYPIPFQATFSRFRRAIKKPSSSESKNRREREWALFPGSPSFSSSSNSLASLSLLTNSINLCTAEYFSHRRKEETEGCFAPKLRIVWRRQKLRLFSSWACLVSLITLQCGSNKSALSPEVSRERPLPRSAISLLRCSGKRTLILPAVVVVASAAQRANYWPDEDRFRKGISQDR